MRSMYSLIKARWTKWWICMFTRRSSGRVFISFSFSHVFKWFRRRLDRCWYVQSIFNYICWYILVFANTKQENQTNLNIHLAYCDRCKLSVNPTKTKVMSFRRGGRVPENCNFMYKDNAIEIVSKFTYRYSIHDLLQKHKKLLQVKQWNLLPRWIKICIDLLIFLLCIDLSYLVN
jgi:hypothetical protein